MDNKKQDIPAVRTPAELERKLGFNKKMKLLEEKFAVLEAEIKEIKTKMQQST